MANMMQPEDIWLSNKMEKLFATIYTVVISLKITCS